MIQKMTTIQNNSRQAIAINFVGENGKNYNLNLPPGLIFNVDPEDWKYALKHPAVRSWVDLGILKNLTQTPEAEGEIDGIPVITAPGDGEPLPFNGSPNAAPKRRKSTKPTPLLESEE